MPIFANGSKDRGVGKTVVQMGDDGNVAKGIRPTINTHKNAGYSTKEHVNIQEGKVRSVIDTIRALRGR